MVRWPGGCFADAYDWRDGVGPREQRPRRTNVWIDQPEIAALGNVPQKFEPNQFGTNEFVRFCELVGAAPYFGANLRTLPPQAFHQWVEYCNAPNGSTTLASLREAGGAAATRSASGTGAWATSRGDAGATSRRPSTRRSSAALRRGRSRNYGVPLAFIGSGPSGGGLRLDARFFEAVAGRRDLSRLWGWALHHYCSAPGGEAVAFDDTAWYELLASADRMER